MADFSKLAGKFDLKGMVDNVKSMMNPNAKVPSGLDSDPLGQGSIEIMKCLEALKTNFEKVVEDLTRLDNAVGNLNQQIMAAKKPQVAQGASVSTPPVTVVPDKDPVQEK